MQRNMISVAVLSFALSALPTFAQSPSPTGGEQNATSNQFPTLVIQSVTSWAGFVANVHPLVPASQLLDYTLNRRRCAIDLAQIPDLAIPTGIGNSNRMLLFCGIKSNENYAMLSHGLPLVH
jgi:hypothetical protein